MKIYNNFLSEDDSILEQINNEILESSYRLHGSGPNFPIQMLASDGKEQDADCFITLSHKILNLPQIKNAHIIRSYINLNPQGDFHSGNWHTDIGDGSNITALFYPQNWSPSLGGGTQFKDGDYIEYERNKLVLFNGNLLHKATSHKLNGFRFSVVFKMIAEWA